MGVLTDFFAASMSDLERVLPGWQLPPPPLPEPIVVHGVNPFTKKPVLIRTRRNRERIPPPDPSADPCPNVSALPNVQCKSLLPDKLAIIFSVMAALDTEVATDLVLCGDLVGPPETEIAVLRLPSAFTSALASATNEKLERAAQAIQNVEAAEFGESAKGSASDLTRILTELRGLANQCMSANAGLFVWICP